MRKTAAMMVIILILDSATIVFSQAEIEQIEFSGIRFKTRYQIVKIDTPILLEAESVWDSGYTSDINDASKLLRATLKNLESAKFSFLYKLTPQDFEKIKEKIYANQSTLLLSKKNAYFVRGSEIVPIDEITINIEPDSKWVDIYKNVVERNFKECKMALDKKGDPDMVCPPLLIKAQITKMERSTLSPFLPAGYVFPHLDYIDIYIEILRVSKS